MPSYHRHGKRFHEWCNERKIGVWSEFAAEGEIANACGDLLLLQSKASLDLLAQFHFLHRLVLLLFAAHHLDWYSREALKVRKAYTSVSLSLIRSI